MSRSLPRPVPIQSHKASVLREASEGRSGQAPSTGGTLLVAAVYGGEVRLPVPGPL